MKNLILLLNILLLLSSCQSKKSELAEKLTLLACQDTKDMITGFANEVVPIFGKALVDYAVPESVKNQLFCECISPSVKQYLIEKFNEPQLEAILTDKKSRGRVLRESLSDKGGDILKCYQDKGYKGYRFMEKFFKSLD